MSRQSRKIKPKPVLFIACEGTSTERDYFISWSQTAEARDNFYAINVYPLDKKAYNKTNPHQLVDLAMESLETEAIDASASPRKPKVKICSKSWNF